MFKKFIRKIHLVMGLTSGLVIVLLGISGCILAFETDIRNATEDFRFVENQNKPYLPPSILKTAAEKASNSHKAFSIEYPARNRAALVSFYYDSKNQIVFLDPYSGKVLKQKNMKEDFFRIVLDGHNYMWLPPQVGQPIIASATLVFVVMMISGIFLWWPRVNGARAQRFAIKWRARWRRRNYDLHNVLGFYMTWIAIFIALTGLVFGFQWFSRSLYWVASGGGAEVIPVSPVSDTTKATPVYNVTDKVWKDHLSKIKEEESIGVYFASQPASPFEIVINRCPGTYYSSEFYHYDQYSGIHLTTVGTYSGPFAEASVADKVMRMNYDIHVGAVLGFPGKLLAFFASLIAASLPITGFLIWRGRKRKSKQAMLQSA